MRYVTADSLYYCPLRRPTMERLFREIFTPFVQGESSTLVFRKGFGGGKALTKFMVDNVDDLAKSKGLQVSSRSHIFVYVDPDELDAQDKDSFWKLVFEEYCKASQSKEKILTFASLRDDIRRVTAKRRGVVFVLRGINYLSFADESLWAKLNALLVPTHWVHFLFVVYEGSDISIKERRFHRIRHLLSQNMVRLEPLDADDVEYVIVRWGSFVGCDFSEDERAAIARVGMGYPSILKACCMAVVHDGVQNEEELRDHPEVRMLLDRAQGKRGGSSKMFSDKENVVYLMLEGRRGSVVTKDEIAVVLWGRGYGEKYSESAIVQVIRRIRGKLAASSDRCCTICSVYGRGYVLE